MPGWAVLASQAGEGSPHQLQVAVLGSPASSSLCPNSYPLCGLAPGLSLWHQTELQCLTWGCFPTSPCLEGHVCTPVLSWGALPVPGTGCKGSGASHRLGAAVGSGQCWNRGVLLHGHQTSSWHPLPPQQASWCWVSKGLDQLPPVSGTIWAAAPSAAQPCFPWGL